MAQDAKKPKRITLIISAAILAVLLIPLIIYWQPLWELFRDPERARQVITDAGPWGPGVFMLLQIAQVVFAPIPGQVTGFVGGYLFGPFLGTLYTLIGATIGFTLIFVLARKLGRPFVEYFVNRKHLEKFDYIAQSNGVFILFLIFLLPAFPDDIICYVAGLTKIKIRTLILISLLGRLPGYIALAFAGSAAESNLQLSLLIMSLMGVVAAVGWWQRKRIETFVRRFSRKDHSGESKDQ